MMGLNSNTDHDLDGIIILDKPSNYDSHQVTRLIQRMLNAESAGHSGTLDPKVTGVITIFLGSATRMAAYMFGKDKEYVGIMRLHSNVSLKKLQDVIKKKFTGKIKQIPPKKSAVKRQEREREIFSFDIIEKDRNDFLFKVHCQSGTYIRKLVHDLGVELKTGAHMLELRRAKEGQFSEKDCVNMYDIEKAVKENNTGDIVKPIDIVCKDMPKIVVKEESLKKLYNGSPIYSEYILKKDRIEKNGIVAVYCNDKLIEIAQAVLEGNAIAKPRTVIKRDTQNI